MRTQLTQNVKSDTLRKRRKMAKDPKQSFQLVKNLRKKTKKISQKKVDQLVEEVLQKRKNTSGYKNSHTCKIHKTSWVKIFATSKLLFL